MKKIIGTLFIVLVGVIYFVPVIAQAKTTVYRSAKTGRYTTKSYSTSHKSTTYKSYR